MAIDVSSAARAAAQAALGDIAPKKKRGLSLWQALAIGAGLVTAGRVATGPGGRFVRELVQDHSSNGSREDEEPEAEEGDDELEAEEGDDQPEAEEGNEPEAEEDDEPEEEAEQDERPETPDLQPIQRVARGKKRQPSLALFERPSRSRSPIG